MYATFPNAKRIKNEKEYKDRVKHCLEAMRKAMNEDEILSLPIPGAFMPRHDKQENAKYRALFLQAVNEFCSIQKVPILVHTVNQVDPKARAGGYGNDEGKMLTSPYALIAPQRSDMDINHFTLLEQGEKVVTMITADPVGHSGNGAKDGLESAAQAADERGARLGPAQVIVTESSHNPEILKQLRSTEKTLLPKVAKTTRKSKISLNEKIKDLQLSDKDESRFIIFLLNPIYQNSLMAPGMIHLAKLLPKEEFKKCLEIILKDSIWDPSSKKAMETKQKELSSFIDKVNNGDEITEKMLEDHFITYEGGWDGLKYLRADSPIGGGRKEMKKFLADIIDFEN